ncbi:MAG: hypothetical protein LBH14_05635 [Desulfobulbaceae bacterium]|nr:hypothetical protein [Desulfobulbaceae bacterium]
MICRARMDKRLLARFTWRDGRAVADGSRSASRPAAGRGVYVCHRGVCLERFLRRPDRWPGWFKMARRNGGESAGMKNQQDAAARRDGGGA